MNQYIPTFDKYVINESFFSGIRDKIMRGIEWLKNFLFVSKKVSEDTNALVSSYSNYDNAIDSFLLNSRIQPVDEARKIPPAEAKPEASYNYDTSTVSAKYDYASLPQEFKIAIDETLKIDAELNALKKKHAETLKTIERLTKAAKEKKNKLASLTGINADKLLSATNIEDNIEKIQMTVSNCASKQINASWAVYRVMQERPYEKSKALDEFVSILESSPSKEAKSMLDTLNSVLSRYKTEELVEYVNSFDQMQSI